MANHMAQWVFKTDDKGDIDFERFWAYYQSGGVDEAHAQEPNQLYFHTIADPNTAVFPLGTYVIYESASPSGYEMSTDKYIVRLVQDGDGTKTEGDAGEKWDVGTYIGDLEPEKFGGVSIQKVDADSLFCMILNLKHLINNPLKSLI